MPSTLFFLSFFLVDPPLLYARDIRKRRDMRKKKTEEGTQKMERNKMERIKG